MFNIYLADDSSSVVIDLTLRVTVSFVAFLCEANEVILWHVRQDPKVIVVAGVYHGGDSVEVRCCD